MKNAPSKFAAILILHSLALSTSFSATISANSPSLADVQAAISTASDSDTVQIPTGVATWTSGLSINGKSLKIVGAGVGNTVITHDIASKDPCIKFSTSGDNVLHMSEIEFVESANGYAVNGIVSIYSASRADWRINNCRFGNLRRRGIKVYGYNSGLIDNCTFHTVGDGVAQGIRVDGDHIGSWNRPPTWGTIDNLYIEDCHFDFGGPNDAAIELYYGGRAVVRHCLIENAGIGMHGLDSGPLTAGGSAYSVEIYENTFIAEDNTMKPRFITSRGGSMVVYANNFSALWEGRGPNTFYTQNFFLREYRLENAGPYKNGYSVGSHSIDGNQALPAGNGTHTGTDGAPSLIDSSKSWSQNQWVRTPYQSGTHKGSNNASVLVDDDSNPELDEVDINAGWILRNITDGSIGLITGRSKTSIAADLFGGADNKWDTGDSYEVLSGDWVVNLTDGSRGAILSNSSNSVDTVLIGGTDNDFDNGDLYVITNGYPAFQQVGWGGPWIDEDHKRTMTINPCYEWSNVYNEGLPTERSSGAGNLIFSVGGSSRDPNPNDFIKEGREYYNNTEKPGYTPYTYPHPLSNLEEQPFALNAPTNAQVNP